jgi:hypothetical protein
MTLSPNCLSAEPAARPSGALTGAGVPGQLPGTASNVDGAPFASLLTQANAAGANASTPTAATVPAQVTVPSAANTQVVHEEGDCWANFEAGIASAASVSAVLPMSAANPATGTIAQDPGTSGAPQATTDCPLACPGFSYTSYFGPQKSLAAATAATMAPVQPAGSVAQAIVVADAGLASGKGVEKPVEPAAKATKDKPKEPAKSTTAASGNTTPEAAAPVYEFVAGQWVQVPQTTVQSATSAQSATCSADGHPSSGNAPAASLPIAGLLSSQNDQPTPKGQKTSPFAASPAEKQTSVGEFVGQRQISQTVASQAATPVPASAASAQPIETVTTVPLPVKDSVAPSADAAAPAGLVARESSPTQNTTATNPSSVLPVGDTNPQDLIKCVAQGLAKSPAAPEKFAAPGLASRADSIPGVITSNGAKEKTPLSIDGKRITDDTKEIGTGAANREIAMPNFVANKTSAAVLPLTSNDGIEARNDSTVAQPTATISAQAPKLVEKIRQIADRISTAEHNSVEVHFDFGARDHLSVRVEYREGTVHATFQTDSSQVREAISREWQAQTATASEQRPYRLAEPVFSSTPSDRQNSSPQGDSSGRQRPSEQLAQAAIPSSATGRNAGATATAAVPVARSFRPETSLHLQAFA